MRPFTRDTFTCPRRRESPNPAAYGGPNSDRWRSGGMGQQKQSCSYCGSMPPDEFMGAVRAGVEIVPTDKNYKAYVGDTRGKFYFQHLPEADQIALVDLLNARQVRFAYPGHFYVLPFFLGPAEGGDS